MDRSIKWVYNNFKKSYKDKKPSIDILSEETIKEVIDFHRSFPGYAVTPIHSLDALAKRFLLKKIWVKDESFRFGLNAFKGLGGSYAIGKYLCQQLGVSIKKASFSYLNSKEVRDRIGDITFITATDGNHGRGVAWAASVLGYKSVVYLPKGSARTRVDNIRSHGAKAMVTDLNYDDTVRLASKDAQENNWVLLQDTAWDGYEEIPLWIMQGYATIIYETLEQLIKGEEERPTHVLLQAGVGSFAGSILGYLVEFLGDEYPQVIILEPDNAACLYKSILIGDGKPHSVTGNLDTIMAGLACGEPSTLSWEILRDNTTLFASCSDDIAALGMRILGNPLDKDPRVISGESGAVGIGFISEISENEKFNSVKEKLDLNSDSKVLVISTEGDTDPVKYRDIVWQGVNY